MLKWKKPILLGLLAITMCFAAFQTSSPAYDEKEAAILNTVLSIVKQVHVKPKPIDDAFSQEVYDIYLKRIDGGKRFLTQENLARLSPHKSQIDDQVNVRTFEFFEQSLVELDQGLANAKQIFNELKDHKWDLDADEFLELDAEKRDHPANYEEQKEVWRKNMKYDIVAKFHRKKQSLESKLKAQAERKNNPKESEEEDEKVIEVEPKTDEELIAESVEETIERIDEWFERMDKLRRSDRFETYLGSITNYFDPHTDYYNPKEKADFDINMGGQLEGIGARLSPDGDYIKVASIIVGGPAWKGKQLEVNDLIMAVTQEEGEPWDITGIRLDDVVQKIRGKKGTEVMLTVKKPDGTVKDITIERDKVIIDESFARSVILDYENKINNIGYIKLPKFYSSFERNGGNSCAADVAEELKKLKEENVHGVILDLRNNTGGSLQDVIKMSGLFIEDGPIVQVKGRQGDKRVQRDSDEDVLYDGPLIVMVNDLSASASEILAAAMQDYGRAIVVGSTSTFGKGSVQRFFDLDRAVNSAYDSFKPLGSLKISLQKFYRVNGGSTQLKGVESDIVLPDNYYYMTTGEKEYDNALDWSEIDALDYEQNVVRLEHLDKIKALSTARVSNHEKFNRILDNAKRLKENSDFSNYPISTAKYVALMEQRKKEAEQYDDIFDSEVENLRISNMVVDTAAINADESLIARNEDWIKGLKKDFYLEETMQIMLDMIQTEESFAKIAEKVEVQSKIRP